MKNEITLTRSSASRLPAYFRCMRELINDDILRISSDKIAERMNISPAQVRSDLKHFGTKGHQGYGYNVKQLYTAIASSLGTGESFSAVYIGETADERMLLDRALYSSRGVVLKACFAKAAGEAEGDFIFPIDRLTEYFGQNGVPQIAVFGPGLRDAEKYAEMMIQSGVKGIWNYSDSLLRSRGGCCVENINPGDSLLRLCRAIRGEI